MKLKDWIKDARTHKKWTQTQLGDALATTKANVSHWENGRHEPSFAQIQQIAELTGYPHLAHDSRPLQELWPFDQVDLAKLRKLKPKQLEQLQAAILMGAGHMHIDVSVEEQIQETKKRA